MAGQLWDVAGLDGPIYSEALGAVLREPMAHLFYSPALRRASEAFRNLLRHDNPGALALVEHLLSHENRDFECIARFIGSAVTFHWRLDGRLGGYPLGGMLPSQGEYRAVYDLARIELNAAREIDAIQGALLNVDEYAFVVRAPELIDATVRADQMIAAIRARTEQEIMRAVYGVTGRRGYFITDDLAEPAQTNNLAEPPHAMTVEMVTAAVRQAQQAQQNLQNAYHQGPYGHHHYQGVRDYDPYGHHIGGNYLHMPVIDHVSNELRQAAEKKASDLLRSWLTPEQLALYDDTGAFWVTGSAGGRYLIRGDVPSYNVDQSDKNGNSIGSMCFYPEGAPAMGDKMLAQKLTLETDEYEAHEISNFSGGTRLVRPGPPRRGLPQPSFYERIFGQFGF